MFDAREYFRGENEVIKESYEATIEDISSIAKETRELMDRMDENKKNYLIFFAKTADLILQLCNLEEELDDGYFENKSFDDLLKQNNMLYAELLSDNYETSYANPAYCVDAFGDQFGQLISYFYRRFREYINCAYTHRIYRMEELNRSFIDVFNLIKNEELDYERLKELVVANQFTTDPRENYIKYKQRHDTDYRFFTEILENASEIS
ncbi:MAG: hypothetical protein ACFFD4_40830, partial [Candidatus Odinarchaeota archaeon]